MNNFYQITIVKLALVLLYVINARNSVATETRIITVEEPPANYINQQQKVDGYVTDIVKAMYKHMQMPADIELIPEGRAIHISQREPNVVLYSFSRTPFREDKYYWIGEVLRKSWYVYSINGAYSNIANLNQLKRMLAIGVTRGDVREEYLIEQNFSNLNSVTNHNQNVQLLLLGRLPLIAYEQLGLTSTCQSLQIDCSDITQVYKLNTASGYIMMSKQPGTDQAFLKRLTTAYNKILNNGELAAISEKWIDKLTKQGFKVNLAPDKAILVF